MDNTIPEKKHRVKAIVDLEAIVGCAKKDIAAITKNTKFTPEVKEEFLDLLRTTANISASARSVGISPSTVNAHRLRYPEFDQQCNDALEEAIDYMELEAARRAFQGVERAIYYQGQVVGKETVYSDTLTVKTLEALRPSKWAKNSNVNIKQEIEIKDSTVQTKLLKMLGYNEADIIEAEFEQVEDQSKE